MTKAEAQRRLVQLRKAIDRYRYEYHVLDRQSISEGALDSLKHELSELETAFPELITADSPSQRVAGKPLPGFTKVKHRQRMVSLADVFSPLELEAWDERWRRIAPRAKTNYVVDLKLDGLAMHLRYDQGVLTQAATRGDGFTGEDVTQNIRTIESVPLRLRTDDLTAAQRRLVETGTVDVRGEVVMFKKDFEALNRAQRQAGQPEYANPRNVSAGTIRQLDPAITAQRRLRFFAWELVTDLGQATLTEAYTLLRSLGLPVNPRATTVSSLERVKAVHQAIAHERERLPFWIDGVVVKLDDRELYASLGLVGKTPRAAVAWKFPAEQATTVVENIVIQVGRTGALTPVAHLRPVSVAGTTVARATLHNADEVERLDVRVGDTVILQKAGDIIPDVVQVLLELRPAGSQRWRMPGHCPVCHAPVKRKAGEAITYCLNRSCPARQRERLYHVVSKKAFDITGFGPSTIDVLMDENLIHQPADIFRLTAQQLVGLPLFAEVKSEKLIAAIAKAKKIRFDRFIFALGIRHVGEQTAQDLARYFQTPEKFRQATIADLQQVPNIGEVVAESVNDWLHDSHHRAELQQLLRVVEVTRMPKISTTPLAGKQVVITGTLEQMSRSEAEEAVRQSGGRIASAVSSKTDYVVVGAEPGSKASRATELGVRQITETEFLRLIKKTSVRYSLISK